jgi:hypothetical protein
VSGVYFVQTRKLCVLREGLLILRAFSYSRALQSGSFKGKHDEGLRVLNFSNYLLGPEEK